MFIDKSHSHSKPASSMCRDTGTYANTEYGRVEPDNLDKIIPSTFFPVRWLVLMCCCCCQHPANFWSQLTRAIFRREAKMNEVLCGKRAIGANIRTQESDYHYFVSPFSCQHRPTSANTYSKCETHALFICLCMQKFVVWTWVLGRTMWIFKHFWNMLIPSFHTVGLETMIALIENIFEPHINELQTTTILISGSDTCYTAYKGLINDSAQWSV